MRLVYWNIRAGGGKRIEGILRQILLWSPDVVGLSEFRGTPASEWLRCELAKLGWGYQLMTTVAKKPATNALLLASRCPLRPIPRKEQWFQPKLKPRWLLAECTGKERLVVGLMHIPNYISAEKAPYYKATLKMTKNWKLGPAIIGGDTNSGKMYLDEQGTNPNLFKREHNWMEGIEARGWIDAFRHVHGEKREFTWYSRLDNGFRLDHAFLHPTLTPRLAAVRHEWGHDPDQPERRDALSDHAALIVDLAEQTSPLHSFSKTS